MLRSDAVKDTVTQILRSALSIGDLAQAGREAQVDCALAACFVVVLLESHACPGFLTIQQH
jgi:hypothetical protein